jgi:hypothetical protein
MEKLQYSRNEISKSVCRLVVCCYERNEDVSKEMYMTPLEGELTYTSVKEIELNMLLEYKTDMKETERMRR